MDDGDSQGFAEDTKEIECLQIIQISGFHGQICSSLSQREFEDGVSKRLEWISGDDGHFP